MLYTSLFALAAALSATAAPLVEVSNLEGPNTFSIPTVKKPNHVKNGAAAYRRALAKYGVDVSQFGKRQDGTVTATPDNGDLEYTCPVQLGSAGTTLNLDFDTGSADLWVFSSLMPSSEKSGHNIYPVSSGTKKSGYTWSISYGDGSSASGSVYTDVVKIGGTTVKNQAVEAAKKAASSFVSSDNDGLVGLAWSSINTVSPTPQKTFFDNAKSGLKSPLFAADLKHDKAGSYDFGYIDSSKYTGSIGYASVDNSDGFWKVATQSYAIGSGTAKSYKGPGIADTGTTLLLMADSVVSAYYAKISGATDSSSEGGYVFPCSATVPSFTLTIAGVSIVIPASYMNYAPVSDGSSTCFGALQSNSGIGFDIYGDIFLKSAYVVFDAGNVRLGVAKKSTS